VKRTLTQAVESTSDPRQSPRVIRSPREPAQALERPRPPRTV